MPASREFRRPAFLFTSRTARRRIRSPVNNLEFPPRPDKFAKWLYSTPSLLFLATLVVGIWASFFSSLYPSQPRKYADFDAVVRSSPSPTPQLSCVELYLQRRDQEFLQNCDIVERMDIYRRQPKMVRFIIAAAGHSTEEARLLSLQTSRQLRKSAEEILGIQPARKYADIGAVLAGATAIWKDGAYSYSQTKSEQPGLAHSEGIAASADGV
jgi:hypothetical protein